MGDAWGGSFGTAWATSWTSGLDELTDADNSWWRRARKARAGTYLYVTDEMRKEKRKLFKRFSRHGY